MNDKDFIAHAIHLAKKHSASGLNGPFGAVIVRDEKIIGEGWNRVVSSNDPTAHAEVMAIRDACFHLGTYQLNGCTIYTSCEPCPMCLSAIYWARINKIVYACTSEDAANAGFDDQFIYNQLKELPEHRTIKTRHFSTSEGCKVFETWKKNKNRVDY